MMLKLLLIILQPYFHRSAFRASRDVAAAAALIFTTNCHSSNTQLVQIASRRRRLYQQTPSSLLATAEAL